MNELSNFTKQCIFDCYCLMKDCVSFEHIEDFEFVNSSFESINRFKIALPSEIYAKIDEFVTQTLHPIIDDPNFFSSTIAPEFGEKNAAGVFVINSEDSCNNIIEAFLKITIDLEHRLYVFAEQELQPYLI